MPFAACVALLHFHTAHILCTTPLLSQPADRATVIMEELLECPVCLSGFEDPRLLPCHHTLCLKCVQGLVAQAANSSESEPRCPLDRAPLKIPGRCEDLPKNFVCAAIIDFLKSGEGAANKGSAAAARSPSKNVRCDDCGREEATVWCGSCGDLCQPCSDAQHAKKRFMDHTVVAQQEKRRHAFIPSCSRHSHNKTDLYCTKCEVLLCHLCERTAHNGHECIPIDEAAQMEKTKLVALVKPFLDRKGGTEADVQALREEQKRRQDEVAQLRARVAILEEEIAGGAKHLETLEAQLTQMEDTHKSVLMAIEGKNLVDVLDKTTRGKMKEIFERVYMTLYGEELSSSILLHNKAFVRAQSVTMTTGSDSVRLVYTGSGHLSVIGEASLPSEGCPPFYWKFHVVSAGHWLLMGVIGNASPGINSSRDATCFGWAGNSRVYVGGTRQSGFDGWNGNFIDGDEVLFRLAANTLTMMLKRSPHKRFSITVPSGSYFIHVNVSDPGTNLVFHPLTMQEMRLFTAPLPSRRTATISAGGATTPSANVAPAAPSPASSPERKLEVGSVSSLSLSEAPRVESA